MGVGCCLLIISLEINKLVPGFLLFCYVPFFFSLFFTVNPRYNDSICSQRRCHLSEFAVVQNT